MAHLYRYPADWDFEKIQKYTQKHGRGDIRFTLGEVGTSFYRVPGNWDFHQFEKYVSKHPGRSPLQYSTVDGLGQVKIAQEFQVIGEDGKFVPAGKNYLYAVTDIKTDQKETVQGVVEFRGKAVSGANGVITISLDNLPDIFSTRKMFADVALYEGDTETKRIFAGKILMPTGPLRINLTKVPAVSPKAGTKPDAAGTNWVMIGGIAFVVLGAGFLFYQLYQMNKEGAPRPITAKPKTAPAVADWE